MDTLGQDAKSKVLQLSIKEYEKIDNFVVYKIEIIAHDCNWVVLRRYREFHRLHEELVNAYGIAWELLPPKKIVGNMKLDHLEKRKALLEKYLKTVVQTLDEYPRVLIEFLELDQFDVHAVCQQLATDLFEIGDDLLAKGYIFKITPLQIHCINRRLQLPLPTCESDNPNDDIGHLYSFIAQVTRIMVHPGEELHLFIGQNDLKYDLNVFKSLRYMEIQMCDVELLEGLDHIQRNVTEVCVHRSLKSLKDILVGSDSWSQGILMPVNSGKEEVNTLDNQSIQRWLHVKRASFSYNDFQSIDFSITLIPNATYLDLSHNLLTEVQFLEELTFLTELDLSYNEIRDLSEFPFRLPSVSKLNVAGNGIRTIQGLEKMYCLEELDLSNNSIETITAILPLGNLPMLQSLHVKGNSLAEFGNHRVRIFAQFEYRAAEILLDNTPPSKREMGKISDMLDSQDSFCVIPDDPFPQPQPKPKPKESSKKKKPISAPPVKPIKPDLDYSAFPGRHNESPISHTTPSDMATMCGVSPVTPVAASTHAPLTSSHKKRDRVAVIKTQKDDPELCQPSLDDGVEIREQVEKLREQAGESWLTFFNEMEEEDNTSKESNTTTESEATTPHDGIVEYKSKDVISQPTKTTSTEPCDKNVDETAEECTPDDEDIAAENNSGVRELDDAGEIAEPKVEENKESSSKEVGGHEGNSIKEEEFEEIMEGFTSESKENEEIEKAERILDSSKEAPVKLLIEDIGDDIKGRLNVAVRQLIEEDLNLNKETFLMVEEDESSEYMLTKDGHQLIRVELCSGLPAESYDLESVSELQVSEDGERFSLRFKSGRVKSSEDEKASLPQLVSLHSRNVKDAAGLYILIKGSITNQAKRTISKQNAVAMETIACNPYNISQKKLLRVLKVYLQEKCTSNEKKILAKKSDTGVETPSESIDIISVSWMGCLPYLFPEEEIPICVVMTMTHVYLFRLFLENNECSLKTLNSCYETLKESMHSFYSVRLNSIREIVVGLFDQSLRVEVTDEGPRGTFLFLTRDSSKTCAFLDSFHTAMGTKIDEQNAICQEKPLTSGMVSIIYPDESKIHILKQTIQSLGYNLKDGENFLSYCIVYDRVAASNDSTDGCGTSNLSNQDITLPFLRTLILTDCRLILCEEDYVRWPLPTFATTIPLTPQWIISQLQLIENVIGIDLWEDMQGVQNMTGRFGITLTFEDCDIALEVNFSNTWNVLFQSLSEREQFVRSVTCLWRNKFNKDINITTTSKRSTKQHARKRNSGSGKASPKFCRGHTKKPSGGVILTPMQKVDCPKMFVNLEAERLNVLFKEKIARGLDISADSEVSVICAKCTSYCHPSVQFEVALILGKYNIYIFSTEKDARFIEALECFQDDGEAILYFNMMEISDLKQVVIGLFDLYFRFEMDSPSQTFVFVTTSADDNVKFIQQLSHNILQLPSSDRPLNDDDVFSDLSSPTNQVLEIYSYDQRRESYFAQPEFIHPNSSIMFVYPGDDTLQKLWYVINDFIRESKMLEPVHQQSVVLYTRLDNHLTNDTCNLVISENLVCLLHEDIVNYPLPLYAKELPDTSQYEVFALQQLSSLTVIEYDDFHTGAFSLMFDGGVKSDTDESDGGVKSESVEGDTCLISHPVDDAGGHSIERWTFTADSYLDRDRIFNVLARLWSNNFMGKSLPVLKCEMRYLKE